MAHLLVHPDATALWENIDRTVSEEDRPAFLDQTGGVTSSREADGEALIALAAVIKDSLDLSMFSAANIGEAPAQECATIDPSNAAFTSAKELLSLRTTYINMHDEVIKRLDPSGNFEVGESRIKKCFDSFIGPFGRGRSIGLFYVFIVWQNKPTRFATRRLHSSMSVSSAPSAAPLPVPATSKQSKRSRDQAEIIHSVKFCLSNILSIFCEIITAIFWTDFGRLKQAVFALQPRD